MPINNYDIKGLTNKQVEEARIQFGQNSLDYKKENSFIDAVQRLAKEPMVLLLLVASAIYFIGGDIGNGIFLAVAIVLVSAISLYQDSRSRNALEKLKDITQPNCKVIRNGIEEKLKSAAVVIGDNMIIEEGTSIVADGIIVHSNDFSVNEATLTGESLAVYKDQSQSDNSVYSGTTVATGLAIITVTAIGNETKLGKIGKSLEDIKEEKTPLEIQINDFVKKMVIAGTIVFIVVWVINYSHSGSVPDSLLKALTLAMSILPEEIPVAFTTFMALGAWRLMKLGVVVKQMKTVETLGSATVICTDKTGTITENKMSLVKIFVLSTGKIEDINESPGEDEQELLRLAMWSSEPIPFDPMEIALHDSYTKVSADDERPFYKIVHEYPLSGKPPMMTHVFENSAGIRIVAAKGAPEALMNVSGLTAEETIQIQAALDEFTTQGYRVLGVGVSNFSGNDYPQKQQELKFNFKGLIAFYDPPKENIQSVFKNFYDAGIALKIITGDSAATTTAICKQIGFRGYEKSITGEELMKSGEMDVKEAVRANNIFTRMFPEAKLKIINALKQNHEIVAMTGDGINDGPALKAAHIGIAMGSKGTEIAKQAASLVIVDDDLSKMVDAIAMGRRIYSNLKKAIRYIISIHIPIVLAVFIPLALGWVYPNIFTPVHIIFFELIMGPTCSIIYENEPMERNTMLQNPRSVTTTFFNFKELMISILQGLAITVGVLGIYQYAVSQGYGESLTRSMVFAALLSANIFLTLINRSFYYSIITTIMYKNNLVLIITGVTVSILMLLLFLKPLSQFFQMEPLGLLQLLKSAGAGFLSVIWFEVVKWRFRANDDNRQLKSVRQ